MQRGIETRQSPRTEYERRQEDRRSLRGPAGLARTAPRQRPRLSSSSSASAWRALVFGMHLFSGWWLLAPVAVFSVLLFLHEKCDARPAAGRAGGGVLPRRPGPPRRRLEGQGPARAALPRRETPLRRRPRPFRSRFAVRAALHGPHAHRRGDAGRLAAAARVGRGSPARVRRPSPSCGRCSTCAKTSPCWAPMCRSASISTRWPPGARPRRC